jgi:hypothetical protein
VHLADAGDAAELLNAASSGEPDALEQVAQIALAAEDGDPEALRAEEHLCAPALLGFPTFDLGEVNLRTEGSTAGVMRRLRAAFVPLTGSARLATATMRALGRGVSP